MQPLKICHEKVTINRKGIGSRTHTSKGILQGIPPT